MALDFVTAGTDVVNHGSDTSLDDLSAVTRMFWIKPDVFASNDSIWGKKQGSINQRFAINDGSGNLRIFMDLSVATISYITSSLALSTGSWHFVSYTFDNAGSTGSRTHIYIGGVSTVAAEPTYSLTDDGGGTYTADAAANYYVGNNGNIANSFDGKIAWHGCWNRVLPLSEILAQQFRPHVTSGCVLFCHYGFNGTGSQADWSGNGNAGTVTGATVADHVSLGPPFGFDLGWQGAFAAAAAASMAYPGRNHPRRNLLLRL